MCAFLVPGPPLFEAAANVELAGYTAVVPAVPAAANAGEETRQGIFRYSLEVRSLKVRLIHLRSVPQRVSRCLPRGTRWF